MDIFKLKVISNLYSSLPTPEVTLPPFASDDRVLVEAGWEGMCIVGASYVGLPVHSCSHRNVVGV